MKVKNIDQITPFLPFVLIFAAAVIGMTSEINLFAWRELTPFASIPNCSVKN